eukprot:1152646-Pelagomonas_calceolata.AAC.3
MDFRNSCLRNFAVRLQIIRSFAVKTADSCNPNCDGACVCPMQAAADVHCLLAPLGGFQGQQGLQGVGLQPETLDNWLLVKRSQPASKNETSSDKNFQNLYES